MDTVTSADGTTLAYERSGEGPTLIIITGAFCDRHTSDGVSELLALDLTVVTYDRRGRGDSGDTEPYAPAREVEDVAALIGAVGGPVALYGHSSGAIIALEAVIAGLAVDKLVVWEPPYASEPGSGELMERLRTAVREGRRGDAAKLFMIEAVGLPPEVVDGVSHSADWAGMEAIAHTLPYDLAFAQCRAPKQRLATISISTLSVFGSETDAFLRASAEVVAETIPDAKLLRIEGHGHGAPADVTAAMLREYLLD